MAGGAPAQFGDDSAGGARSGAYRVGFTRQTPAHARGKAEPYLLCVSVVVVVTGAGTEVCSDVVVLLLCVVSEAQPDINATATMVRQEAIIFFIGGI